VIVPELTLNLAVLDPDAADDVIAAHPEIARWVIGGHSLGGTFAARYANDTVRRSPALCYGLGTTLDDINRFRNRCPANTDFVSIEGGTHAQFGDYGPRAGDNPATISRPEQQAQAVQALLRVLRMVE